MNISDRLGLEVSSQDESVLELFAKNNTVGQVFEIEEKEEEDILKLRISKETAKKLVAKINEYLEALGEV